MARNGISSSSSSPSSTLNPPRRSSLSAFGKQQKRSATEERFNKRFKTNENSPEEILKLQMGNWTSKFYEHYTLPPEIEVKTNLNGCDRVFYKFRCKTSPSIVICRDRIEDSTSNLRRHAVTCEHEVNPTTRALEAFAHGSTYNPGRFRLLLTKWVVKNYRPFAIVEDEELGEILRMLDCRVKIPSRVTISRDIREVFGMCQAEVQTYFKNYEGKVHIGIDGWTSPNVYSFLGLTVHYIHNGEMKTIILDFIKLTRAHDGHYLAEQLSQTLERYHLTTKLLGIVCDNASNNDTMIASLSVRIPDWGGSTLRVRCAAHVLNLVVKGILSVFAAKKAYGKDPELAAALKEILAPKDAEDDMAEYEDGDDGRDAADQAIIDKLDDEDDTQDELEENASEIRQACIAVEKLKGLAKAVFHSPTIRHSLEQECARAEPPIPFRVLVRPVATRWNSLTMTIKSALELRPALNALVDLAVHNRNKTSRLRRYSLEEEEWNILEQLLPLLDRFLEATNIMSRSSYPSIHSVIPLIDQLTESLQSWVDNKSLHPAVRIASSRGLTIMNKYYGLTDDSIVYRIAMIMHPRRKIAYFHAAKWPEVWIQTAINIAREEWIAHFKPKQATEITRQSSQISYFSDMDLDQTDADAFEIYISSPPIVSVNCPIMYWQALQQAGDPLAPMALQFLTCPAASTDVERAFSRGRLTVSRTRHSLVDETTRSATVLSSWLENSDFIPEEQLINIFDNKQARPKNGRINEENEELDSGEGD